jgi:hypothetical protein
VVDLPQVAHAHAAEAIEHLHARDLDQLEVRTGQQHVQDLEALDQACAVLRSDGDGGLTQAGAQILGHTANHAEVDERQLPLAVAGPVGPFERSHEQVARMRVGVEETVLQDLLHVGAQQRLRDLRPVDPGCGDRLVVAQLDGRDVFEGQHPACREVPDHTRYVHARTGDEVRAEGLGVAALGEVVDLGPRGRGELVDEGFDVGPVADRLVAL